MKILIPNAKELNTNLDSHPFQPLSVASQEVVGALASLTVADLARFYKLKEERAQLEADRWERIQRGQAKTYPAWQLYDGLMYRYMKRQELSPSEEAYLSQHARIATGLYGLISPFDLISPHRLDFQGHLTVGGQSLKQFWRTAYDEAIGEDPLVLSLLSSEFEQVFSPKLQKRMIRLLFVEERGGQLKIHSTISKKGRGRCLSLMAQHQIESLDALKEIAVDGFHYRADQSSPDQLVYVKVIEEKNRKKTHSF